MVALRGFTHVGVASSPDAVAWFSLVWWEVFDCELPMTPLAEWG